MEKEEMNLISLKELFNNNEEFIEALGDALIIEKLKTPTKYSIEVEDIENKLKKKLKAKNKFIVEVLFTNFKRYLYKHILELENLNK